MWTLFQSNAWTQSKNEANTYDSYLILLASIRQCASNWTWGTSYLSFQVKPLLGQFDAMVDLVKCTIVWLFFLKQKFTKSPFYNVKFVICCGTIGLSGNKFHALKAIKSILIGSQVDIPNICTIRKKIEI
jgi:hypothetical protein